VGSRQPSVGSDSARPPRPAAAGRAVSRRLNVEPLPGQGSDHRVRLFGAGSAQGTPRSPFWRPPVPSQADESGASLPRGRCARGAQPRRLTTVDALLLQPAIDHGLAHPERLSKLRDTRASACERTSSTTCLRTSTGYLLGIASSSLTPEDSRNTTPLNPGQITFSVKPRMAHLDCSAQLARPRWGPH
jgi:hypothetical protein